MTRAILMGTIAAISLGSFAIAQDASAPEAGQQAQANDSATQTAPERGPRGRFSALDTDGNGQISAEEREAAAKRQFEQADADGDGTVTTEEMVARIKAMEEERLTRRAERMIEARDRNGDGVLTADEMQPMSPAERMFNRADQDGDGMISKAEFEAAADRMAKMHGARHGRGKSGDRGHHGGKARGDRGLWHDFRDGSQGDRRD